MKTITRLMIPEFAVVPASTCLAFFGQDYNIIYYSSLAMWLVIASRVSLLTAIITLRPAWAWHHNDHSLSDSADSQFPMPNVAFGLHHAAASLFGARTPLVRLSFIAVANATAAAAPWATGRVLGEALKQWWSVAKGSELQHRWQLGWGTSPLFQPVAVLGFPMALALLTAVGIVASIYNALSHIRTARVLARRTSRIRPPVESYQYKGTTFLVAVFAEVTAAADSAGLGTLAELMHLPLAADPRTTPLNQLLNADSCNYTICLMDKKEFLDMRLVAASALRYERFLTKTLFAAGQLFLKVSWVMLIFDDHLQRHDALIAIALSLYTVMMQCKDQVQLVLALFHILRFASRVDLVPEDDDGLTIHGLKEDGARVRRGAQLQTLKQGAFLIFTILLILASLIRLAGAFACGSHLFNLSSGCVEAWP